MEVLILTLFVSLMLAAAGVGFFVWSIKQGAHEHGDRLALLPVEAERTVPAPRDDEAEPSFEQSSFETPEGPAARG